MTPHLAVFIVFMFIRSKYLTKQPQNFIRRYGRPQAAVRCDLPPYQLETLWYGKSKKLMAQFSWV